MLDHNLMYNNVFQKFVSNNLKCSQQFIQSLNSFLNIIKEKQCVYQNFLLQAQINFKILVFHLAQDLFLFQIIQMIFNLHQNLVISQKKNMKNGKEIDKKI
jgi:hypothetical protein